VNGTEPFPAIIPRGIFAFMPLGVAAVADLEAMERRPRLVQLVVG
jgi:hypothetical protein